MNNKNKDNSTEKTTDIELSNREANLTKKPGFFEKPGFCYAASGLRFRVRLLCAN